MKKTLSTFLLVVPLLLFSQQPSYKPLVSTGTIPNDFLRTSKEIVDADKDEFIVADSKKEKKLKEKFLIQSTFSTNDLLQTGIVTFNDPVTAYINTIADNLLKHDPSLRSKLRFYAAKLPNANAMTFNNGIILINLGLIAQLENESQLAFIICHEISHYVNQDAIEKFIEYDGISKGKGIYKELSSNDREIEQYRYSKEKETIADEDGLELFLKSNYDVAAIQNVFDILKYSYLPIDEIPFDKAFLESTHYKIREEFLLEAINPIDAEEKDDEKQTHPNTSARKRMINELLAGNSKGGNKVFIQGESLFNEIRKTARFEVSRIYLKYGWYEEAIYNSYVLLQFYPEDLFLKKNIAKSLTAIAMHVNNSERLRSKSIDIEDDLQGESQQLYNIIRKMTKEDRKGINVLALSYVYELHKANSKDEELEKLFDALVKDMIKEGDFNIDQFKKSLPIVKNDTVATEQEEEITEDTLAQSNSKLAKIEEKSKLEKIEEKIIESEVELYLYAFVDYLKDEEFVEAFEKNEEKIEKREAWLASWKKMNNKEKKKNYNPWDIEKVVVIDPFYVKIGAKKSEKYKFFESESGEISYTSRIEKIAAHKKIHMDVEILDFTNAGANDVTLFNDLFLANEWFSEQSRLDDIDFSSVEIDRIDDLVNKYGTEYFMWTGIVDLKDRNAMRSFITIYLGVIFPPSLLFSIPKAISRSNYTIHFNVVKNIKTGETVYANVEDVNFKTNASLLDAKIFSELYKISKR